MSKKSIERKAAQQAIITGREQGKTDQQIYNELSPTFYDKKVLAALVTGTVTPELKNKYSTLNNVLVGLLVVSAILKLLAVVGLSIQLQNVWFLIMIFLAPLLNIYFAYEISRYNALIYRACGLIVIGSAGKFISDSESLNAFDIGFTILFATAIAGMAFYLDKYMFPNYSPGKLKKDNTGEYILE